MDEAKGLFLPEDENLREKGDWSQFTLWQQGELLLLDCSLLPVIYGKWDTRLVTSPRARIPQFTGICPENLDYQNPFIVF